MLVGINFIRSLVVKHRKHTVYSDMVWWSMDLKLRLHSPIEESLMERVCQYFKDRTEDMDDYYPHLQEMKTI